MLRAHPDFERLGIQVDTMPFIQVNGQGVHLFQAGDGGGQQRAGMSKVAVRLLSQTLKSPFQAGRIATEIKIHTPAEISGLVVDKDVDQGGTADLPGVERPLVPFEEYPVERFVGRGEIPGQEFPLYPLPVDGDIPGQYLLIGAGHVPSKGRRGQTVLPFL